MNTIIFLHSILPKKNKDKLNTAMLYEQMFYDDKFLEVFFRMSINQIDMSIVNWFLISTFEIKHDTFVNNCIKAKLTILLDYYL